MRIEADGPFAVYADGDHLADLPATVRLLPRALRVIVPRRPEIDRASCAPRSGSRGRSAALSRRSGRGGGTTLPGRLLLRLAPDAIARLGRRLTGGTTIDQRHQRQDDDRRDARRGAARRRPRAGPQPRRLEHDLGRRDGAARAARRARGCSRSTRPGCPRIAPSSTRGWSCSRNLFRDQLDRYGELEHLADEWAELVAERAGRTGFVLNADDPLIADLGRDA